MNQKVLSDFVFQILKHFFDGAVAGIINADVPKATKNLNDHGHGFSAAPTDAERDQFTRHAVRQFFRITTKHGFPADMGRDFFAPVLAPKTRPLLVAGLSTQQAAQVVANALIAEIEALESAVGP